MTAAAGRCDGQVLGVGQTITGSSGSTLEGAVYMPQSNIQFTGNSATSNGCTQVIGLTVTFSATSSLNSTCTGSDTLTIETNKPVAIDEYRPTRRSSAGERCRCHLSLHL